MLKQAVDEKNQLQDSKTQLGEELKDVWAQLADSVKENKRLRGGIFSMCSYLPPCNSARKGTNSVMSVGMMTGRPEQEVSGSSSDLLQGLPRWTSKHGRQCGVLPRLYGRPPPLQEV